MVVEAVVEVEEVVGRAEGRAAAVRLVAVGREANVVVATVAGGEEVVRKAVVVTAAVTEVVVMVAAAREEGKVVVAVREEKEVMAEARGVEAPEEEMVAARGSNLSGSREFQRALHDSTRRACRWNHSSYSPETAVECLHSCSQPSSA